MTARATTLKGVDAGAYYIEVLPNYYLDSGEPKGVWHGRGAERLGLEGEIIDGEFLRIMAGLHPRARGGVHLGRPYGEDSVRGFDVTASARSRYRPCSPSATTRPAATCSPPTTPR